jgi:sialate O-acetylesterase
MTMRLFVLLCCLVLIKPSFADVSLPKLISNHMILQRDMPLKLWGWANSDETVSVWLNNEFVGKTVATDGQWQIPLAAQTAGGPYVIKVIAENTLIIDDVYFGDVWLASGQSNMELSMARVAEAYPQDLVSANYPQIRQFLVPQHYNFKEPQDDFASGEWMLASSTNVSRFSAVAFYFARELYQHNGVPIGILNNALGGSPVEAWMSEEALQAFPESLAEAHRFRDDQLIANIQAADSNKNQQWYGRLDKLDPGLNAPIPWYTKSFDDSDWQKFSIPGDYDQPDNKPYIGTWWLRKTLSLSAEEAENVSILRLGTIVDADTVYVNGIKIGNTTYQYPPRRYALPAKLLHEGENLIAVRVTATGNRSGFVKDKPYWLGSDDHAISLVGEWRMHAGQDAPPLAGDTFIRWKAQGLYNGLTAPLTHYAIKGVIWYQGESNTGRWQDYQAKFTTMISDWRKKWGQGDFPFLFVQLANFMAVDEQPQDGGWAQLRWAQHQSLAAPNTAMAVAIDIGEWNDIHPVDKKTLGKRLALAARALALNEKVSYQGPTLAKVEQREHALVVHFNHTDQGLVIKGQTQQSFAIAGDDNIFHWAEVKLIDNNRIQVSHPDISQPTQVRYAWGDNPQASVYNGSGLPAPPFKAQLNDGR